MSDAQNDPPGGTARPIFEYRAAPTDGARADLIGLWEFNSAPRTGAVAFAPTGGSGATAAAAEDAPVWRVELPAGYEFAVSHLRAGEARLRASQKALTVAARGLAGAALAPGATATGDVSARVPAELATLFGMLKDAPGGVSFGLRDDAAESWAEISGQFVAFLERVRQMIAHYAWVETSMDRKLLCRTVVSWTGDMTTLWQASQPPSLLGLHRRALALALQSRDMLIRILIVVAKGAVLISTGSGVLALPLIWEYVQQIMAEVRGLDHLGDESGGT